MATVILIGRILCIKPAAYGEIFHAHCTVNRIKSEYTWQGQAHQPDPVQLYWYADDPKDGEQVFCTYAGYLCHIVGTLRDRGVEVKILSRMSDGLEQPNFAAVAGVSWRPKQKEIVAKLLAAKGGLIDCSMGYGKTFIIKQLAKLYDEAKIVITVPRRDVARDIYNSLKDDLPDVGIVGGGRNKPKRITVAVSKSLHKCSKDSNLLIVDECHGLCTDAYIKELNKFYRAKFFGFTATTKGRGDKADGFLEAVFGPVLAKIDYPACVELGCVVPINVRMFRINTGPAIDDIQSKVLVDKVGLWTNASRNLHIAKVTRMLETELGADAQILVMVDRVEHAYLLGQQLPDYTIVTGTVSDEKLIRFQRRGVIKPTQEICTDKCRERYRQEFAEAKLKHCICTKIWREGVDFPDLQALIRADGTAGTIDANQVSGRLSRLGHDGNKPHGLLVDFIDAFSKKLMFRSRARIRIYTNNGWGIKYYEL